MARARALNEHQSHGCLFDNTSSGRNPHESAVSGAPLRSFPCSPSLRCWSAVRHVSVRAGRPELRHSQAPPVVRGVRLKPRQRPVRSSIRTVSFLFLRPRRISKQCRAERSTRPTRRMFHQRRRVTTRQSSMCTSTSLRVSRRSTPTARPIRRGATGSTVTASNYGHARTDHPSARRRHPALHADEHGIDAPQRRFPRRHGPGRRRQGPDRKPRSERDHRGTPAVPGHLHVPLRRGRCAAAHLRGHVRRHPRRSRFPAAAGRKRAVHRPVRVLHDQGCGRDAHHGSRGDHQ